MRVFGDYSTIIRQIWFWFHWNRKQLLASTSQPSIFEISIISGILADAVIYTL